MSADTDPARDFVYHFPRIFAARNDEGEHTFGDGRVYGKADRRACARRLIALIREARAGGGS